MRAQRQAAISGKSTAVTKKNQARKVKGSGVARMPQAS
jgi:hypothetical protein